MIHARFHVSGPTWDTQLGIIQDFAYGIITLYDRTFQTVPLSIQIPSIGSHNPMSKLMVWAIPRSLAATYGISVDFFSSRLLRCFTSLGIASITYFIQLTITGHNSSWVAPFGNLRIKGYLQLPEAYRSLARPSSPLIAKASIIHP